MDLVVIDVASWRSAEYGRGFSSTAMAGRRHFAPTLAAVARRAGVSRSGTSSGRAEIYQSLELCFARDSLVPFARDFGCLILYWIHVSSNGKVLRQQGTLCGYHYFITSYIRRPVKVLHLTDYSNSLFCAFG